MDIPHSYRFWRETSSLGLRKPIYNIDVLQRFILFLIQGRITDTGCRKGGSKMPRNNRKAANGVQTVTTTYRDFESREYLTSFVNDMVQGALSKYLARHNTRIDVTLDNSEKRTRRKLFNVGITLRPAHKAPIHINREANRIQDAVRAAVTTVEKILRRDHAKLRARRHKAARVAA